jgi:hypothetical protein
MIKPHETLIVNIIRHQLLGKTLPPSKHGNNGRGAENLLENVVGIPINIRQGIDIPILGWEVKTRGADKTSAQTVASMHPDLIVKTPYKESIVYKKIRKQLRFTTDENDIITNIDIYDFDQPQIQELLESAYEHGRSLIQQDSSIQYTPYEGYWGYFENTKADRFELDFRIAVGDMDKLIAMTSSTFRNIFQYE